MSQKASHNRSDGVFLILSGVNGWSLLAAAALSLAFAVFAKSPSGILVSLALGMHAGLELGFRSRWLRGRSAVNRRRMAVNQIALAVSLSVYFAYQFFAIDDAGLVAAVLASPAQDVLQWYPAEIRVRIVQSLPAWIKIFYAGATLTAWTVCVVAAFLYWPREKRLRPR